TSRMVKKRKKSDAHAEFSTRNCFFFAKLVETPQQFLFAARSQRINCTRLPPLAGLAPSPHPSLRHELLHQRIHQIVVHLGGPKTKCCQTFQRPPVLWAIEQRRKQY